MEWSADGLDLDVRYTRGGNSLIEKTTYYYYEGEPYAETVTVVTPESESINPILPLRII